VLQLGGYLFKAGEMVATPCFMHQGCVMIVCGASKIW